MVLATCSIEPGSDAELDEGDELAALLRDAPLHLDAAPPAIALPQPPSGSRAGHWRFDDCDAGGTELADVGDGHTAAVRSGAVACRDGAIGRAVAPAVRGAVVYAPDQPHVRFGRGVTVAAWLRPGELAGTQTLFRKRNDPGSAFALVLQRGQWRFVVDLGDGRAAGVAAPARAASYQHVAASYDGSALRLYLDGRQVAARAVTGAIPSRPGPLLIGNDGAGRRFDGAIDEAVFDLRALTAPQVLALTCIPAAPRVVATADRSAPALPDEPVAFDIAVTNRNPAACPAMDIALRAVQPRRDITLDPGPVFQERRALPGGETAHFRFTATAFDAVAPGRFPIRYDVFSLGWGFSWSGSVELAVAAPTGCHVHRSRELMITDLSVVEDPVRTAPDGPAGAGAWSFRRLVEDLASTADDAPALVEDLLRSFTAPQVIEGATVQPRPGMARFLDAWPRGAGGRLDLARAPLQLQAIVDRIDLRDVARGSAGKASFVFAFVEDGFQLPGALMFEYQLPAASEADVRGWAEAFHALGAVAFSGRYNAALQAITDRFARRGARPDGVNHSALVAVHANETVFGFDWQLRSFALSRATGRLVPAALDGTPDPAFNGSPELAGFIAGHRDAIIAGGVRLPDELAGRPFRAGAVRTGELEPWHAFVDGEARRAFALATCNGCHSPGETGTAFRHLVPPFSRGEVARSPFLRGATIADPVTGEPRFFDDLRRRADDLAAIVCPSTPGAGFAPGSSLRRGISRVH